MKIKYEALRLFLAGTALLLTAMLTTPTSMVSSVPPKIHLEKSVSENIYGLPQGRAKKSKAKSWNVASYHARK